jgi:hypothetical protein
MDRVQEIIDALKKVPRCGNPKCKAHEKAMNRVIHKVRLLVAEAEWSA